MVVDDDIALALISRCTLGVRSTLVPYSPIVVEEPLFFGEAVYRRIVQDQPVLVLIGGMAESALRAIEGALRKHNRSVHTIRTRELRLAARLVPTNRLFVNVQADAIVGTICRPEELVALYATRTSAFVRVTFDLDAIKESSRHVVVSVDKPDPLCCCDTGETSEWVRRYNDACRDATQGRCQLDLLVLFGRKHGIELSRDILRLIFRRLLENTFDRIKTDLMHAHPVEFTSALPT